MSVSIWRHASQTPSFLGIPCIAYTPIFLFLFHTRWWTFWTVVGVIAFSAVLAKFGLSYIVLWQRFLHLLRGSVIYARPWWYRNRFQDTDL